MKHNLSHLRQYFDAAETVFLQRELEQILAGAFDKKYALLKGRSLVQTGELIDPGAETVVWRASDQRGAAAPVADFADDLPVAQVTRSEESAIMRSYGLAYNYSLQELKAAAKANRPLDRERADAVRKGLAQKLDNIIATGDSALGLKGLLNLANTDSYTTPDGAAGSKAFEDKTADEILTDLFAMVDQVADNTLDIEHPTKLVMPPAQLRLISRMPRKDNADTTVLEFFKRNRPGVDVSDWLRCAGAGATASDRMMAFNPDPLNVRLLLAFDFEQMAPQQKNGAFVVNNYMRTGGIVSPFPKSIIYGDHI